jgi:phosphopantothenate---cysteine ligase (ATP)
MHVVVANLLANYKEEVVIVTQNEKTKVRRSSKDEDLEEQLIGLLMRTHSEYMNQLELAQNCL